MVKSVSRALDIIAIVSGHRGGLGVTDISKRMDINKSSVYRILTTLTQYGYIEQDEATDRYKLGYQFLAVSTKLLESIDLRTEARPFLQELEKITNEVIHLVVYDQGEVVYIEKLEGNETLRMHSKVGKRAPMHCTSVGKAILAYLPTAVVHDILDRKGLPVHTEYTITDKDQLLKELEAIKKKGFALDLEENEQGITCMAVPLFDHLGNVVAAMSISGHTRRMTDERLSGLQGKMLEIGHEISKRLGFVPIQS
jgi:DNA-binding IclR family transcriptional regulator